MVAKRRHLDEIVEGPAVEREPVDQASQNRQAGWSGAAIITSWLFVGYDTAAACPVDFGRGVPLLHYKIYTDTQQAVSARDEALVRLHDVLGDRLGGVETRLHTLETMAGNLRQEADQIEAKIRETANASADDFTAVQSAMTARLVDVEAQLADLLAAGPPVSDADVQNNAAFTEDLAENLPP